MALVQTPQPDPFDPLNGAKRFLKLSSQALKSGAAVSIAAAYGYIIAQVLEQADKAIKA